MNKYPGERASTMHRQELYFWTATINGWKHLLVEDSIKMEIVQSLQWLKAKSLISVYAYVIMPNHIHLLWKLHAPNGKESAKGSLLKFTAHQFCKLVYKRNPELLKDYEVDRENKKHEFWQRDPLAVPLYSRKVILQKMDYIHNNPVSGRWQLAHSADAYRFSSSSYYQTGVDEFGILTHIGALL